MSAHKSSIDLHGQAGSLSKEQSILHGQALRSSVPLKSHATWMPTPGRADPVALLRSQGTSRVQALLPLRYERMSASAFTFYRGGALIMASDLSGTPVTGIKVQDCGDAHISNFGLYLSPERRTVFDINDFDETLPGPWEWDVKRLATSVEICGRDNGFTADQRTKSVLACVRAYREGMAEFASMGHLDVWYTHFDVDSLHARLTTNLDDQALQEADQMLAKIKGKGSARAMHKLTEVVDGELRVISSPPVIVPVRELGAFLGDKRVGVTYDEKALKRMLHAILDQYRATLSPDKRHLIDRYTAVDAALKVVGVGSVGTRAWIVVMRGADESDPLVLQVKEAQESVLELVLGKTKKGQHGHRVVTGQRAIQTVSDLLLGWCQLPGEDGQTKDYIVRQLWDGKGSIDLSLLKPRQLANLAEACGWVLAHAHARTGDRFAIAAYLGDTDDFDRSLAEFAVAYADQNELDYQRFMEALGDGELV